MLGLQLESIIYASMRHEKRLDSGEKAGFLLGDGAGIGKGRQSASLARVHARQLTVYTSCSWSNPRDFFRPAVAGLIFENFRRGRKKAVWFSASQDLADGPAMGPSLRRYLARAALFCGTAPQSLTQNGSQTQPVISPTLAPRTFRSASCLTTTTAAARSTSSTLQRGLFSARCG